MGPLQGVKVVEFAGIGPGPFCAMMLSDMGAEVVRIDRTPTGVSRAPDLFNPGRYGILDRGRRSVGLDLKRPEAVEVALRIVQDSDALVEGMRPGVMERLGLGPDTCLARNPRLVYGRMTGWGQEGPLATRAGHDIDYIALTGALHAIGGPGTGPVPPLNLVGDFGGGGMLLAFGVVCGLLETRSSGRGQVVDAAMTDGAALLMAMVYGMKAMGRWSNERGTNLLDGGAHFYGTYECRDGRHVAVGAIEPKFYRELLGLCGAETLALRSQDDPDEWPALREDLGKLFRTRSRDEWCELLEGTDACVAPVLDLDEAPRHPHNRARGTFVEREGVVQPAPAPRFSRTAGEIQGPPARPGAHTEAVMTECGYDREEILALIEARVVFAP
jgi:alpha-methylacyl-CoA racemase